MHEIVSAILGKDTNSLRSLLRQNPALKSFKSEAGFAILELAEKTNDALVEACIYRETQGEIEDPEVILRGIMATFSNDYFCAQYESGIEHTIWYCLENKGKWPPELESDMDPIDIETLSDIQYIITKTGCWYSYEDGIIPISKWKREYL